MNLNLTTDEENFLFNAVDYAVRGNRFDPELQALALALRRKLLAAIIVARAPVEVTA